MNIDWIINRCNKVLFGIGQDDTPTELLEEKELATNLSLASRHGVLPLVILSLSDVEFPTREAKKTFIKWYTNAERSKEKYRKRVKLMESLSLCFKKAGLDVMFLKGATTAQLYPEPQLRMFGDIDYYMFGESDKSIEVLNAVGIKTSEYFNHHTQASAGGILLENHYDFLDRQNHQGNLLIDDELKRLASVEGHQYSFKFDNPEADNAYCMSPTMNALFLMRHMAAHFFSETVPLRMLYDWALFLNRYHENVDWNRVNELYKQSGMAEFPRMIQGILVSKLMLSTLACPIEPLYGETTEKVWQSIIKSPASNPYKKNSVRFLLFEAHTFAKNRWKHQIVFEDESYIKLFLNYVWLYLNKKVIG